MFFIFGWGHTKVKDRGEAYPLHCPNCNNKVFFHLTSVSRWFTFFFVPLIPYSTKHYLMCPVCTRGKELSGEQEKKADEMIDATKGFVGKTVNEEEYMKKLEDYKKHLFPPPKLT